ncbi:MAG: efflux RND transporter periplasmic adaptor subunit [Desulfobacterales bacterium]|nr:efflux RND transporter periplasmic adaptor subunit [Desulfobacterales bacterium]
MFQKYFFQRYFFIISILFVSFCMGKISSVHGKEAESVISVEAIHPIKKTMEESTTITGSCVSIEHSTISAKVSGIIDELLVDEGDRIEKDQILAKIDDVDYSLDLELIDLQLVNAKANLEKGSAEVDKTRGDLDIKKIDFERIKNVYSAGSFPKQTFDHAKNAYDSALSEFIQSEIGLKILQNQVAYLGTQVKIARKKVSDCNITAPFAGFISERMANIGEWVSPGKALITLEKDNPIEIEGEISEIYLERIKTGMPIHIGFDGLSDAYLKSKGYSETVLKKISPIVDPTRRTLKLTVEIKNSDYKIKPGLYARMQVIFNKSSNAIVIPQTCIISGHDSPHVFIVNNNKSELKKITTGIKQEEFVEVTSGLSLDSIVVFGGQSRLLGGETVKVQYREVK